MRITDIIIFFIVFTATLLMVLVARAKTSTRRKDTNEQDSANFLGQAMQATADCIPPAQPSQAKDRGVAYSSRTLLAETSIAPSFHAYWLPLIKQHLSSRGHYYFPLLLSLTSYLALYSVPYSIQQENETLYRFVQYTMLSLLPALICFNFRPTKLIEDIFWSWLFSSSLLFIYFGLGTSIILMSGFGQFNTFAFLVHLAIALLISPRLIGLSVVVIIAIGIVIIYKAFSGLLGHVITADMSVPFLVGYWLLLLSSLYISFVQYHYQKELMKPRPGKLF